MASNSENGVETETLPVATLINENTDENENEELPEVDVDYHGATTEKPSASNTGEVVAEVVEIVDNEEEEVEEKPRKKSVVKSREKGNGKNKYTMIDNLDEDDPIVYDGKEGRPGRLKKPLWGIFSVVTPEGVMNTKMRCFKVRGVFEDYETAVKWADKIGENDVFDVFVGDLYKWLPLDSDTDKATHVQYRNKKEQKLIMQQRENEMNELVGRKKALLEKEKKGSRRRKADRILSGRAETGGASMVDAEKEEENSKKKKKQKQKKPKMSRNANREVTMSRMKRLVLERKRKKEEEEEKKLREDQKRQESNISQREENLKAKEKGLNDLESNISEIRDRLRSKKK